MDHDPSRKIDRKRLSLRGLLTPYRWPMLFGFMAVIGESAADLLEPWPLKIVLDNVLKGKEGHAIVMRWIHNWVGSDPIAMLKFACFAVLAIAVLDAVCSYAEKYFTTSVGQWISYDLRRHIYAHIQKLSLAFHDNKRTGDLISRVTDDIDSIQSFITSGLLSIFIDVMTLLGMAGIMFYLNWRFTLIALSIAPALFIVVFSYTRRIKKASRAVRKKEGEITSVVEEVLSSMRVVKAFAREDYEVERLAHTNREAVDTALHARSLKAKLTPIVDLMVAVGTCLVLWFGARLVMSSQLSAGDLVLFVWYLGKMYKPMRDLSKMTDTYTKAAVGYERIREVMDTDKEIKDVRGAITAPRLKGDIEFEHVSFQYAPDSQPVLEDVSLRIESGQVAALAGPTGAGKTSIVSLIARFYDPTSGVVKIDGRDVRRYKQQSLRQQMSFVLQETVLFHGTIWENIAYGKPEATPKEIIRAAELANASEFIDKLPQKYCTVVGERGITLSGGQRQRIAIARAVIRESPILILDEPTSGLDAGSEKLVFEALDRLMETRRNGTKGGTRGPQTVIVIAHRLSTIRRADVIFVVADGHIVESGKHDELLKRHGVYAELHDIQFGEEPPLERKRA